MGPEVRDLSALASSCTSALSKDLRHMAEREATPGSTCPPRRVLIVDDNRDAAESLRLFLAAVRFEARIALDGESALEIAGQFKPEAILLDIGLPDISGFDVARRLREQPWAQAAVLCALTGWGQDADRQAAREAGFDHYFTKPIDIDMLLNLLENRDPSHQVPGRLPII